MTENENPCEKPNNQDVEICEELVRIFGSSNVDAEWDVCTGTTDDMRGSEGKRERYCPVVDYVVGPFNTAREHNKNLEINELYDDLIQRHGVLIDNLFTMDRELEETTAIEISRDERKCLDLLNVERETTLTHNINPRCFLAIEIEKETGRKHVLGGLVHASALGKIGIIITPEEKYRSTMKIRRYLRFLVAVRKTGKPSQVTLGKNTILLPREKFLQALREYEVDT